MAFQLKVDPVKQVFTDGQPFANSKYFEYGDYHIHYREDAPQGEVKAKVFMIHGFGCSTAFFDELVVEYNKRGYYVVRIDIPDFGFSTRETKGIKYVPTDTLVLKTLDYLSDGPDDKWIVLGHSMGGSVALQIASEDDTHIAATILNCPLLMANIPSFVGKLVMTKPITSFFEGVLPYFVGHNSLMKLLMYTMTIDFRYSMGIDGTRVGDPFKLENTGIGLCYMTSVTRTPSREEIKKIKVPIQLVWGSRDIFVMPGSRQKLADCLPQDTDSHLMLKGGHCLINNYAPETANVADIFITNSVLK